MIRVKFMLSRAELKKLLDDEAIWAQGKTKTNGDVFLSCTGDVDSAHLDEEGHDCVFYIDKRKEDWDNKAIKPTMLFKGRTLIMFKKWQEQFAEYRKRYNEAKKELDKREFKKIL